MDIYVEESSMLNNETKYSKPMVEIVYISSADIITESNQDNEFDIGDLYGGS